jgi:hypothetical protein
MSTILDSRNAAVTWRRDIQAPNPTPRFWSGNLHIFDISNRGRGPHGLSPDDSCVLARSGADGIKFLRGRQNPDPQSPLCADPSFKPGLDGAEIKGLRICWRRTLTKCIRVHNQNIITIKTEPPIRYSSENRFHTRQFLSICRGLGIPISHPSIRNSKFAPSEIDLSTCPAPGPSSASMCYVFIITTIHAFNLELWPPWLTPLPERQQNGPRPRTTVNNSLRLFFGS